MTIEEIQSYFEGHFYVERLTFKIENKDLIKGFKAPEKGYKLGEYLHEKAWNDDLEGETKVYLIKDDKDFLVAFFSIKCGLLYDNHEYEKLKGDELEFVNLVVEQCEMNLPEKVDTIQAYYDYYDQITDERKDELMKSAFQRYDVFEEVRTSKDGSLFKRVHETYSAIEIAHFCKNELYEYNIDNMQGVSLGSGLFWMKIYDRKCQAMVQDVSEIERDGNAFWARYRRDN